MAAPQQPNQQAIQKQAPEDPKDVQRRALQKFLFDRKIQFDRVLPKGGEITLEKLIATALLATKKVDQLLNCSPDSILLALMDAAELGLTVHWGLRGEAALVPFRDKKSNTTTCTLLVGYKGLIKLARKSGIRQIHAEAVRSKDAFRYAVTERGVVLRHTPLQDESDPITKFYAVAWTDDSDQPAAVVVMPKSKVDRIRGGKDGVWADWYTEMGLKTAIRALCKTLGSEAVDRALEVDDQHTKARGENVIDGEMVHASAAQSLNTLPPPRPVETIEFQSRPEPEAARVQRTEEKPAQQVVEAKQEAPAPTEQAEPHDEVTGEVVDERPPGGDPDSFTDDVVKAMRAAADAGDMKQLAEVASKVAGKVPKDRQDEVSKVYGECKAAIKAKKAGPA